MGTASYIGQVWGRIEDLDANPLNGVTISGSHRVRGGPRGGTDIEFDVINSYQWGFGGRTVIAYGYPNRLSYGEGRTHVNRDRQDRTLTDRIG